MKGFVDIHDPYSIRRFKDYMMLETEMDERLLEDYLASLTLHIMYVQEIGKPLGVSEHQLLAHDQSKFTVQEFIVYAGHFHDKPDPQNFAYAWLHHIHHNPHHWQHWIFSDGHTPPNSNVVNGVLAMPERYALEMIADWMGASRSYTGSWDMEKWLCANWNRIQLHPETKRFVAEKLKELGYSVR